MWTCSGVAQAASARISLLRETVVDKGSIYLSDLLPKSAPSTVLLLAREIVVGQSPRPGSIRVLTSDAVSRILGDDEELLDEIQVPERIVVRRAGRLITKEEVTKAIQATLLHNKEFSKLTVTTANVRFAAAVLVSAENADLQVTRIEVDHALQQLNFWLVSGADPAILPFLVMVRPQGASSVLAGLEEDPSAQDSGAENKPGSLESIFFRRHFSHANQKAVVIVEPGKTAQLHLISGKTTEMFLPATALERGSLGQQIRVRLETSGRVMEAQVVGPGRLEAQF